MEEHEFRRLLDLFPVVRSPDYQFEIDSSRQSASQSRTAGQNELREWHDAWDKKPSENQGIDLHNAFWNKLKLVAERKYKPSGDDFLENFEDSPSEDHRSAVDFKIQDKDGILLLVVGPAEAEKFCQEFQRIHKKLVYEGLSLDAARSYITSSKNSYE